MRSVSIGLLLAMVMGLTGCVSHAQRIEKDSVLLYLKAPEARSVQAAASFNAFDLQDAERDRYGYWFVRMPNDRPFSYFFLVDGEPYVPDCQLKELDDFGQANCVFSPRP